MTEHNPAATAAQDQSDAAFTDAMTADVLSKGLAYGGVTIPAHEHASDALIRERFLAWIRETPQQCIHQPLERGRDSHWLAWAPEMLRCVPCVNVNHQSVAGTEEDRRCDICHVVQPVDNPCIQACTVALQTKPMDDGTIVPPILLHYGRCCACADATLS